MKFSDQALKSRASYTIRRMKFVTQVILLKILKNTLQIGNVSLLMVALFMLGLCNFMSLFYLLGLQRGCRCLVIQFSVLRSESMSYFNINS